MNELISIRRSSQNYGLIGGMSRGKSIYEAYVGYMRFLSGDIVFSNMPLNYPHVFIDSIEDIYDIRQEFDVDRRKFLILDDAEFWFNSRNWARNKLGELTIFFGKISCSIIWSTKRGNVDVDLRDITDEFNFMSMYQYKEFGRVDKDGMPYLNDCLIMLDGFDSEGNDISPRYLLNLDIWCNMYSTMHMLEKLKKK